jgi:hypothetical protein
VDTQIAATLALAAISCPSALIEQPFVYRMPTLDRTASLAHDVYTNFYATPENLGRRYLHFRILHVYFLS